MLKAIDSDFDTHVSYDPDTLIASERKKSFKLFAPIVSFIENTREDDFLWSDLDCAAALTDIARGIKKIEITSEQALRKIGQLLQNKLALPPLGSDDREKYTRSEILSIADKITLALPGPYDVKREAWGRNVARQVRGSEAVMRLLEEPEEPDIPEGEKN